MAGVLTGLERVASGQTRALVGKRIGLIANPTAVDSRLHHAADILSARTDLELVRLFGPEHGLRGDAQDMIAVDTERDARTGLPVYSLYGHDQESLAPTVAMLDGLDALVFDIQDVGARYYTYVWTMVLAMRVCARAGVEMIVLDRPNPIGGLALEGGAVEPGYESFVGLCSVPNRHGLTAGEIARGIRAREHLDVELTIVPMLGWQRSMYYENTGLPWVMPSPNMPTRDTALVYPGMCLVEGTELSEGRGTTRPFELSGAPFIEPYVLCTRLGDYRLPGVSFRPVVFRPTFHKHAHEPCGGVQIHVTDVRAYLAYHTGVAILHAIRSLWPELFAWRTRAYEFVDDIPAIDLLTGSSAVRLALDAGAEFRDITAAWQPAVDAFSAEREPWLLYPPTPAEGSA